MKKRNLLKTLSNDNFLMINRDLIKELGLEETVLFAELCYEQFYWEANNKLQEDGTFYSTVENIEERLGLKKKKQLAILKKLKEVNLIEIKYHDTPRKRYIKVNVVELEKMQDNYKKKKNEKKITLKEDDYDIIDKVFFENEFSKEIKKIFSEYVLVLKREREFNVTLRNVRGLAKSLRKFKECSIEEQKKIIYKSKEKRWSGFYPLKNNDKTD